MPLKNLFKPRSAKPKADPRIRWFGKLPTYPDYYSSGAGEPWAAEFNDWVLKGFELYRSRQSGRSRSVPRLPLSAYVLRLPSSSMTVFGSILDFGGDMRGRPFPMCFYVGVPTADWPGPTSDRVGPASRALRDLLALRWEVGRFLNSPGEFVSRFSERELDLTGVDGDTLDTTWMASGRQMPFVEWFAQVRDLLSVKDRGSWEKQVEVWSVNLAKHVKDDFQGALRLPMVVRESFEAQLAGWIRWLETRLNLNQKLLSITVTETSPSGIGHLTVMMRDLMVDDFLLVTPLATTLCYVDDLSQFGPDGATEGRLPETLDGNPPAATWTDFVCRSTSKA